MWCLLIMGRNWQLVTNRKLIYHGFYSKASSTLEGYGDVAQMVERLLRMREVRGSMPRISKTFWGFDNSIWCLLIMWRNWQLLTNRKLIYHEFCSEASSKLEGYGDVAQTVERLLRMREVRGSIPRGFDNFISFWLTKGKNWQLVTNRKLIYHEFCSQATSKLKGYGDVAQMVERSLRMRGVRGSMHRISKSFWGFDNSIWCLLIMWRNWQLLTNRKLIYHGFCSEASSKLKGYGDVAQMVERSLRMWEVRGSMPRISKRFSRLRQFYFVLADNRKELTTQYKSKADKSWSLFRS